MSGRREVNKEAQEVVAKALRRVAFEHDFEKPYETADYIIGWAGENGWPEKPPHRSTIADYFRGKAFPPREFVDLFMAAVGASAQESVDFAWVYTFPLRTR